MQNVDVKFVDMLMMYLSENEREESSVFKIIKHLESDPSNIFNRKNYAGHITSSGIVLNDEKLLLIHHPFLGKWIQPGGHVEDGESPMDASIREVFEETGFATKPHPWHLENKIPFDINIHEIPENKKKGEEGHLHFDFRYLLVGTQEHSTQGEHCFEFRKFEEIDEENIVNVIKKMKDKIK